MYIFSYRSKRLITVLSFLAILTSCANRKINKQAIELEPVEISDKDKNRTFRSTAPIEWDITHTRVGLEFDWKSKTAKGNTWINLHPYYYFTDSIILDAKSMEIHTVNVITDGRPIPVDYIYQDDKLKIKLPKQYSRYDSTTVNITYTAMPYSESTGGSKAISDDRGLYFINTDYSTPNKPAQIWTQGETEANSHWLPTIDKPNNRFTLQIELTVPDSLITLSNGELISQKYSGEMRTDIWKMDKPIQAYAAMFAIGKFSVVEDMWRNKKVSYYVEPDYEPYARYMFNNTTKMLDFFSGITGVPYPWNKYSQIVVRDYVSGAMENTTASLYGEFMNQSKREIDDSNFEDVVAHELFHQWFGNYVTAESWSHINLNESFASYGEQLWRRHHYGNGSADILGAEELDLYLQAVKKTDPPLTRFYYTDKEDVFDRISYEKGGKILNYLHGLIGDSAFYKALNIYLTKNALQSAETVDWRLAVEEATGKDWNWFFDQWYYKGGHPQLDIKYRYDDIAKQLKVLVTQKQDSLYILPLKVDVIISGTNRSEDWLITKRKEEFTYNYEGNNIPVIVPDSKHWLVGELLEDKLPQQWLVQFKHSADNILSRKEALQNVKTQIDDESSQAIFNLALNDKESEIRKQALQLLQKISIKKWQDKWQGQVIFIAQNDVNNNVKAAAYDLLGNWKITNAKEDMLNAIGDSSYAVSGAALLALNKLKVDTVYPLSKKLLEYRPRANQQAAVWEIIGKKGNPADTNLYLAHANYFYGRDKINFTSSCNAYLLSVPDIDAFEVVLDVMLAVFKNEQIKSYRNYMAVGFYETALEYKNRVNNSRSNAEKKENELRLKLLKTAGDKLMQYEQDENNKKLYRPYFKKVFGS